MKRSILLLIAFLILFCLAACDPKVTPAAPLPENARFVYRGHEALDNGTLGRYPEFEPLFGDQHFLLQDEFQNPDAPKERTISINGADYTLPYLTSRYRINESEPLDLYKSATQESLISASFLPNGGGLVSFSDSPLYEYKFIETDLSENGAEYFQNLADQAIKRYYKANPAAYRVSVETEQHLSREDGGRSPIYEGFVSEQQDLSYSLCVRNYCFTYTKYAKNTPTQETIQVKVRQDGRIVWLSTRYPGSMDAYTDFEVPEDKIREAAQEIAKNAVNSISYDEITCKAGAITLCLDQNSEPYYRVEVTVRIVFKEGFSDIRSREYTDELFLVAEEPERQS